jgi:cyanophycin synthetase
MFATGIALGMGVSLENIRLGLRTFSTDFFQAPGRLNFYNELPFRVILDYAHNAHGMAAVAKTILALTVRGRRIGVISAPGDRRDEDILELAREAAPAFDLIILREDDNKRGRKVGEVGEILRRGLIESGLAEERIVPGVYEEQEAIERSLATAEPGDLLVIFGDDLQRAWQLITGFGKQGAGGTAPAFEAAAGIAAEPGRTERREVPRPRRTAQPIEPQEAGD